MGVVSIMNGSDVTPSHAVPLENWAKRIGLSAVTVDCPSMICWWTCPALRVATVAPLIATVVLSSAATTRNVSPLSRVFSGTVRNDLPHPEVLGNCSTR